MTYYRKHQKKAINRKSVDPVEPADKNKIRNENFANDTWEDKRVVLKSSKNSLKSRSNRRRTKETTTI